MLVENVSVSLRLLCASVVPSWVFHQPASALDRLPSATRESPRTPTQDGATRSTPFVSAGLLARSSTHRVAGEGSVAAFGDVAKWSKAAVCGSTALTILRTILSELMARRRSQMVRRRSVPRLRSVSRASRDPWRRSQMGRRGSAKPLCIGSIPIAAFAPAVEGQNLYASVRFRPPPPSTAIE